MRNIVYLTDENYAMPTCVSIVSLMKNNTSRTDYNIYILANEISDESREKLQALEDEYVVCECIDVNNKAYEALAETCLTKGIHVSKMALFKFDIANILKDVDKVLYLDGDTIINHDISDLFSIDISEHYLAAADDMGDVISENGKSSQAQRIGIENRTYFNSGVMYLNLGKMREDHIPEKLLKYRMEEPNYFMDQDALNAVLGGNRISLSSCYNFLTVMLSRLKLESIAKRFGTPLYNTVEECIANQTIIHMADKYKPWCYNIPLLTDLFKHYYYQSVYRDMELVLSSKEVYYEQMANIWEDYNLLFKVCEEGKRKIWPFPFSKIQKGSKVVLYGAGNVGKDMYHQIELTGYCELVLWVDRDYATKQEIVKSPECMKTCTFDYIIIAIAKRAIALAVREDMIAQKIDSEKVVFFY